MGRKSRYNIPVLFWRCPHCGFEHTAADLVRIDCNTFRCKGCGKPFPSGRGEERSPRAVCVARAGRNDPPAVRLVN